MTTIAFRCCFTQSVVNDEGQPITPYPMNNLHYCCDVEINRLKDERETLRATLAERDRELDHLRCELANSEKQATDLIQASETLRAQLAERDDRISWLETQREVECKQKQDAFNERDGFAKELAATQEKLERALIDNNQLIAEKVNQGAELLATQEKLKEAEKSNQEHFRDAKSLAMQCMDLRAVLGKCVVQLGHIRSGYILGSEIDEAYDLALRLVSYEAAIQAHAGECRSVLKLVDATNERAYTAALKLLASQPDLTLIEEVREGKTHESPDPQSAIKESKIELMTKLLTAQLYITELRSVLLKVSECKLFYEDSADIDNYTTDDVMKALSSKQDISLVEEVEGTIKELEDALCYFNRSEFWRDEHGQAIDRGRKLLTRINPRK